jgi:hypothetical protein
MLEVRDAVELALSDRVESVSSGAPFSYVIRRVSLDLGALNVVSLTSVSWIQC